MDFIIFLLLIFLWFYFGRRVEKKHYESLVLREEELKHIVILSERDVASVPISSSEEIFISEGVAIALDAFKKFFAGIINIIWGRVRSYESLVDRARREAVLRVKEKAHKKGYNTLINLRLETSSISKNAKKTVGAVEVLAYATALKRELWK